MGISLTEKYIKYPMAMSVCTMKNRLMIPVFLSKKMATDSDTDTETAVDAM